MNRRKMTLAIAALGLFLATCAHFGPRRVPDASQLYLQDLAFDPTDGELEKMFPAQLRAKDGSGPAIVQYDPAHAEELHAAILQAGGIVYGPLPRHGLLVSGLEHRALRAMRGVRFAGAFHPAFKLTPALRKRALAKDAARDTRKLDLAVLLFGDPEGAAKQARALGGTARIVRLTRGYDALVVSIAASKLSALAQIPSVRNIEPTYIPRRLLDVAPVRMQVRSSTAPPWTNIEGLDGSGQVLGIYDSGADTGDTATLVQDLRGRVTGDIAGWTNTSTLAPQSWADLNYDGAPDTHGTNATDAAIGNGATSAGHLLTGVAFAATAIMRPMNADSNGLTPGYLDINKALTNSYQAGARVHNDSWGSASGTIPLIYGINDAYTTQTTSVADAFTYQNPEMLIVVSAGNEGPSTSTISDLGCSKNALTVGASGNGDPPTGYQAGGTYSTATPPNQIANYSSRGPAIGGQIKPEVVAPGAMVAMVCTAALCPPTSPYDGQPGFMYETGTSFAAPLVSGMALLLRQMLVTQTKLPRPTGMVVKALIVNGASQLVGYAPDDTQGWGLVSLKGSIDGSGGGEVALWDSLSEPGAAFSFVTVGQSVVFEDVQPTAGATVAITLAWFDPPAASPAGRIVNDLDLTLTTSGGVVYRGGRNSMNQGHTQPNGAPDTVNNTEKLIIYPAPAQPVTITVTAVTLAPGRRQPFAVVMSGFQSQGELAARSLVPLRSRWKK